MNFCCNGENQEFAIVNVPIASIKLQPQNDSELADEVLMGMGLEVLADAEEWLYVKTQYNYTGYISKQNVEIDIKNQWKNSDKQFIIAAFADVQSQPKYSANSINTILRGSLVIVTGGKADKWVEVVLPNKETGWIRKEALLDRENEPGAVFRQAVVDTALLYLGTQYRWGGKSPMGIDCSGLSSMAYMLNGILIPRDSDEQMNYMKKIERRQSKPGDLLFFPGHVAIYIGEDKFVHATGSDAIVKINSLNKDSKLYRKDLDEKYICTGTVF